MGRRKKKRRRYAPPRGADKNSQKQQAERAAPSERQQAIEALTPRQRQVLRLLLSGKTKREISEEFDVTHATVSTHCARLYRKLNVNSRFQLIHEYSLEERKLSELKKERPLV